MRYSVQGYLSEIVRFVSLIKPRGKITALTNFARHARVRMFLKYSRTEDLLGQNQNDVMLADESFFCCPLGKSSLDQQLQLVLPTITQPVVMSKLMEKIKEAKKGN